MKSSPDMLQGSLRLNDLHFYAYHGLYPQERVIGGRYVVNAEINFAFTPDMDFSTLEQTANYELVYRIIKDHMQQPTHLIEAVVHAIIKDIRRHFPGITGGMVKLEKLDVPMGGHIGSSSFEARW